MHCALFYYISSKLETLLTDIVPARCQAQRPQAGPRLHVQRRGKHGAGGAELVSQRC